MKTRGQQVETVFQDNVQNLISLGFRDDLENPEQGPLLGRVISRQADIFFIQTAWGILRAGISGRLSYTAVDEADLPQVGDWVLAWWDALAEREVNPAPESKINHIEDPGLIVGVLPRRSCLSRLAPGGTSASQVFATNVDTVFITIALDRLEEKNPLGGIQRFISIAESGGSRAVCLATKADTIALETAQEFQNKLKDLWPTMPCILLGGLGEQRSAAWNKGLESIQEELPRGHSGVLVGLSGVGKSSIIARLLESTSLDLPKISKVREHDNKGKHTTTHREIHLLPWGACLLDSPGIRSIGMPTSYHSSTGGFASLEEFSNECRFADCTHTSEPGCRVQEALAAGELAPEILTLYRKQEAEAEFLAIRNLAGKSEISDKQRWEAEAPRRRWKAISKTINRLHSSH